MHVQFIRHHTIEELRNAIVHSCAYAHNLKQKSE